MCILGLEIMSIKSIEHNTKETDQKRRNNKTKVRDVIRFMAETKLVGHVAKQEGIRWVTKVIHWRLKEITKNRDKPHREVAGHK